MASRRNISTCCAPAGSKRHRELLAPFGLDAPTRLLAAGPGVIEGLIDELEAMGRPAFVAAPARRPRHLDLTARR